MPDVPDGGAPANWPELHGDYDEVLDKLRETQTHDMQGEE